MPCRRASLVLAAGLSLAPLAILAQAPQTTYHQGHELEQVPCCERELQSRPHEREDGEGWEEVFEPVAEEVANVEPLEPFDVEFEVGEPRGLFFRYLVHGEAAGNARLALLGEGSDEPVEEFRAELLRTGLAMIKAQLQITPEILESSGHQLRLRLVNEGEDLVSVEVLAALVAVRDE